MTTYVSFESALHLFTVAYMLPMLLLAVVSTVGLSVIETID